MEDGGRLVHVNISLAQGEIMPKMVTADITFQRDKSGVMLDTWNHYLNKDDRGCVLGTLRRGLLRVDSTTHQKMLLFVDDEC